MSTMNEKIRCMDCGYIFSVPDVVYEEYEAYGSPFFQKYEVCPICKSWALETYIVDSDEM